MNKVITNIYKHIEEIKKSSNILISRNRELLEKENKLKSKDKTINKLKNIIDSLFKSTDCKCIENKSCYRCNIYEDYLFLIQEINEENKSAYLFVSFENEDTLKNITSYKNELQKNTPFGLYHHITEYDLDVLSKFYSILLTGILTQEQFLEYIETLEKCIKENTISNNRNSSQKYNDNLSEILNVCNKIIEYKYQHYPETKYIVIVNRRVPMPYRM